MRRQKDQQVRLDLGGRSLLEGPTEDRQIPQAGDLCFGCVVGVLDQATDHDGLIVVHNHGRFRLALGGDGGSRLGFADECGDLLRHFQAYRFALTDLGGDAQGDADIFELKATYS